jgi:hypothetical protein
MDNDLVHIAETLQKPTYNYKRIMQTREKIRAALKDANKPLLGDVFTSLVGQVKMALPVVVTLATVSSCLSVYLGRTLTTFDKERIAKRLAGNLDELVLQRPVLSWCDARKPEWSLVEVSKVEVVKKAKGPLNRVCFDALTGSCAGYELSALWSFKKFNYMAILQDDKGIGFGLTRAKLNKNGDDRSSYTYSDYRQLVGMHCFALIDPHRSTTEPEFYTIGHSSGTMAYNRALFSKRSRLRSPCLLDARVTYDCYVCPAGRDRCENAIRALSCTRLVCRSCKAVAYREPRTDEDPVKKAGSSYLCFSCSRKVSTDATG